MNISSNWPRNRLLLALPSSDIEQLLPELEQIRRQRELVLMDADSSLDHVFFPDGGVVSAVAVYVDGSIIEMATMCREVALLCKPLWVPRECGSPETSSVRSKFVNCMRCAFTPDNATLVQHRANLGRGG